MTVQPTFQVKREDATSFWSPPERIHDFESVLSPAVAPANDRLYMVWWAKGGGFRWSNFDQGSWSKEEEILKDYKLGISSSPALAQTQTGLLLVWQNDRHIICSAKFANGQWEKPNPTTFSNPGIPAIVSFDSNVLMVWKNADSCISYSVFNNTSWSQERPVPGVTASARPALVFLGLGEDGLDKVLMAWMHGDHSIHIHAMEYLTLSGKWRDDVSLGLSTSNGPALTLYDERPLIVWKSTRDSNSDEQYKLYYSYYTGHEWVESVTIQDAKTQSQPNLAYHGDWIYLVWKEHNTDKFCYSRAQSIGSTVDFGRDPKTVSFDVCHDENVDRTFIKQADRVYKKGKLYHPTNSQRDIEFRIGNGSSQGHVIKSINGLYQYNDIVNNIGMTLDADHWIGTLPRAWLVPGGSLHLMVVWEHTQSDGGPPKEEDPVIVVNVGN